MGQYHQGDLADQSRMQRDGMLASNMRANFVKLIDIAWQVSDGPK